MRPIVPVHLRPLVCALVHRPLDRGETNELAALCHDLALVAVRNRLSAASLQHRFNFKSHTDISYDCIADLFRQDDAGLLMQFKAFFDAIDIDGSSDEELLVHLRRLVFSRVNHGLFRILHESDPELGRIIRNIKLAVQGLPAFAVVERFGETCLAPVSGETLEHLPPLEMQDLVRGMADAVRLPAHIPGILAGLALFLRRQEQGSRVVSIVRLALAIRALYEGARRPEQEAAVEDWWTAGDIEKILGGVLSSVRDRAHERYVLRKNLCARQLDTYMQVIEDLLLDRFVGGNGDSLSLFARLQLRQPELKKEEYKTAHRSTLEYLCKIATREAERQLRSALR